MDKFIENYHFLWHCRFGVPAILIADQSNKFVNEFCAILYYITTESPVPLTLMKVRLALTTKFETHSLFDCPAALDFCVPITPMAQDGIQSRDTLPSFFFFPLREKRMSFSCSADWIDYGKKLLLCMLTSGILLVVSLLVARCYQEEQGIASFHLKSKSSTFRGWLRCLHDMLSRRCVA